MGFALCCRVCCFCVVCGCFCVVVCCVLSCVVFVVVWCVVSWLCCVLSWLFLLSLSVCVVFHRVFVCRCRTCLGSNRVARFPDKFARTRARHESRVGSSLVLVCARESRFVSACRCWWSAARSWPSVLSGRRRSSIHLQLRRRACVCASGSLTCSHFDCAR